MSQSRRAFLSALAGAALLQASDTGPVQCLKTPQAGLQPQAAVDSEGTVHLIYLYGDPSAANVGYVSKTPHHRDFSAPLRVNSIPQSAIALGTVRGAHLALGKSGQVHVAWNGSGNVAPMLYSRLNERRDAFEPQRNLMGATSGLDGGGTLAADTKGNVYVTWHAQSQENGRPLEGEGHRRVWLAHSTDDGRTFAAERPVSPAELGACGCCGMGALTDEEGNLYLLYRSARENVHRDMYLLTSRDQGRTFDATNLHPWQIGACPMSTVSLASDRGRVLLSWETEKQVYWAPFDIRTRKIGRRVAAPGEGSNRKHPAIAANANGQTLLVWTEGTGWKRGGLLAWQLFDPAGRPLTGKASAPGLPAWDFAAAVAVKNQFLVVSTALPVSYA